MARTPVYRHGSMRALAHDSKDDAVRCPAGRRWLVPLCVLCATASSWGHLLSVLALAEPIFLSEYDGSMSTYRGDMSPAVLNAKTSVAAGRRYANSMSVGNVVQTLRRYRPQIYGFLFDAWAAIKCVATALAYFGTHAACVQTAEAAPLGIA